MVFDLLPGFPVCLCFLPCCCYFFVLFFGLSTLCFDHLPVFWIMILDYPNKIAFGSLTSVSEQFVTYEVTQQKNNVALAAKQCHYAFIGQQIKQYILLYIL